MKITVINGPNLNLLGIRKPEIYGRDTLADICDYISARAESLSAELSEEIALSFFQSNCEGELIDCLHEKAREGCDAILLNAGAYTHYSYAIRDAIEAISDMGTPVWEVHLSDVENREAFRRISVIREVCRGCVFGLGKDSYTKALEEAARYVTKSGGNG